MKHCDYNNENKDTSQGKVYKITISHFKKIKQNNFDVRFNLLEIIQCLK